MHLKKQTNNNFPSYKTIVSLITPT